MKKLLILTIVIICLALFAGCSLFDPSYSCADNHDGSITMTAPTGEVYHYSIYNEWLPEGIFKDGDKSMMIGYCKSLGDVYTTTADFCLCVAAYGNEYYFFKDDFTMPEFNKDTVTVRLVWQNDEPISVTDTSFIGDILEILGADNVEEIGDKNSVGVIEFSSNQYPELKNGAGLYFDEENEDYYLATVSYTTYEEGVHTKWMCVNCTDILNEYRIIEK